jgi:hypothetical protein
LPTLPTFNLRFCFRCPFRKLEAYATFASWKLTPLSQAGSLRHFRKLEAYRTIASWKLTPLSQAGSLRHD